MFDEEYLDPHGECTAEIRRLEAERDQITAEVERLREIIRHVIGSVRVSAHIPFWSSVGFALKTDKAQAMALCEEFGFDPITGERQTKKDRK